MRGRPVLLLAAGFLAALPALRAEAAGVPRRVRIVHARRHFLPGLRPRFPVPQPPILEFPPPDEFPLPGVEEPPGPSEEPFEQGPLPHGFVLTVPVGGSKPAVPASLRRYPDVGRALGACWEPPTDTRWSSITLRVSFKRDGSVNGMPRIPFSDAASPEQKSELAHSLLAALNRCAPLPFSPSLGTAIAGEIFAIRFTNQDAR